MPNVGDIIRAEDIKSGGFIGQIIEFPSNLIPSNTLLCDGSELSRDTYSELFNVIGTIYGEGDGSTTFNIPDYRGAFLRCIGGNAAELGVEQSDAMRDVSGMFGTNRDGVFGVATGIFHGIPRLTNTCMSTVETTGAAGQYRQIEINLSAVVPTSVENRPINYAVNVCVVFE